MEAILINRGGIKTVVKRGFQKSKSIDGFGWIALTSSSVVR